ncbi:GNAT family N-acetyltransferase [Pseudonocardia ailaonensis]|uniref:GNAT family N-acetyltransferase n=1 Tax=Pseudonocardia ailaonensis TaxID=367279 RepID=A0ABN2MN46_9PSEU
MTRADAAADRTDPETRTAPSGSAGPAVRVLDGDGVRVAHGLFGSAIHMGGPVDDERWARTAPSYTPGRTFGVDDPAPVGEARLAGSATSFASALTVPGGARIPMAAVTRVGVRADRTRRGLLSALMTAQLRDSAARGEIAASLRATETAIYGRFGYGVATRGRDLRVPSRTPFRAGPSEGGDVRMVTGDEARTVLPEVYARAQARIPVPGVIERDEVWWGLSLDHPGRPAPAVAVHRSPTGPDDGYVVWTVTHEGPGFADNVLEVQDLQATTPAVLAALWRFVLGIDLVREVKARLRPIDDPLELFLTDPRAARTTGIVDETWLRLLDVPAALAARAWGDADPVRIRVHDRLLPGNEGVHVIGGSDAGTAAEGEADLECDVAALAMAYLGDRRPSELVASGWWSAHDPAAVTRADVLFATPTTPWSGTFF